MKNSLWKFTALVGVVGIVVLAFVQAQQGLNRGTGDEFAYDGEFSEPDLGAATASPNGDSESPADGGDGFDAPTWEDDVPTEPIADAGADDVVDPDADDPWAVEITPRRVARTDSATAEPSEFDDGFFTDDEPEPTGASVSAFPGEEAGDVVPVGGETVVAEDDTVREPRRLAFDEDPSAGTLQPLDETEELPSLDEPPTERTPGPKVTAFDPFPSEESEPVTSDGPALRVTGGEADTEADPGSPFDSFDDEPPSDGAAETAESEFDPFAPEPSSGPANSDSPDTDDPAPARVLPREAFAEESEFEDDDPSSTGPAPAPRAFEDDEPEFGFEPDAEPADAPELQVEPAPRTVEADPAREVPRSLESLPARAMPETDDAPARRPRRLLGDGTVGAASVTTAQRPRLTIRKVAPPNAVLGQPLVYTILVENVGESAARQVVVEDRIPKGSELTGTIPRAELVETTLRWKLGTLEPGAKKKIAVRVTPLEEGNIGSIATVNFVAEVAARTRVTAPKLELKLDAPELVQRGKPVPIAFHVTNHGRVAASGVLLRNLLPTGLSHPGGDDLEYPVGDLAPGESRTVKLTLTAAKVGEALNRAIVTADGGARSEDSARITVAGSSLAVARTGPSKRYVGRPGIYANAVTNQGLDSVTNITVVERLPEGLDFVEAASGGQYNPGRREVAWRIDRLGPKESKVLKVKLVARRAGALESKVVARVPDADAVAASATVEAVGFAALALDVDGGSAPVVVGDELPLVVKTRNRGSAAATDLGVTIEVSPELELVSAKAPVEYDAKAGRIRFAAVNALPGGKQTEFELRFRAVKPGDARIRTRIDAGELSRPLQRDEAVLVVPESP